MTRFLGFCALAAMTVTLTSSAARAQDGMPIEGLLAEGTRTTTTWPEGSMGNDRPIATVHENWVSVELKVVVLYKSMDPRFGESTEKLTNISRSEPDQNLFQPPPEYAIVDEKGSFTIKWGPEQQ